jgi:WD40 repeat protein
MMTTKLRAFVLYLLPLLLAGCPSAPVVPDPAEVGPVPQLDVAHSTDILAGVIRFLEFSEDGSTFAAGSSYSGVVLYKFDDYVLLEAHYERDKTNSSRGESIADISAMGYIDANTWYFTAITTDRPSESDPILYYTNIHIRSIQPSKEIAKYSFEGRQDTAVINDYIALSGPYPEAENGIFDKGIFVNWRTGTQMPVKIMLPARNYFEHFELTRSNRLLTTDRHTPPPDTVLADPLNNKTEELDWYVTFSPDERYAIDFSERRCKLRKFSGRDVAPIQKQEIAGYCSERLSRQADKMRKEVSFSPDGKSFVVANGRDVRVYRVEPFQLALEIKMPGSVHALTLSDDDWLAVSDESDFFRVWDVGTGSLVGQNQGTFFILSRFQPGGNKLMAVSGGSITVFALPERSAR